MYDTLTLEFNKLINKLKNYVSLEDSKELLDNYKLAKDYDEVIKLQHETDEAFKTIIKLSSVPILSLNGVNQILNRASIGGILTADELLLIVKLIDNLKEILNYYKSIEDLKLELKYLSSYYKNIEIPKNLKSNITLAISVDGNILDNASKELFVIRKSIKSLENKQRNKINEILETKSNMLTDNISTIRNSRICFPVKVEYKNTFKGIIHDTSSSALSVFIEPEEIIPISNEIENFKNKEKKEIEIILKNLSLLVKAEADILDNGYNIILSLDQIYAKALMAKDLDYNFVNVINANKFNLKKAFHPLIDKKVCVPIDVELKETKRGIIITGPNTGGKTVSIKTIGLLHIMTYFGMMVPASSDSTFAYYKDIFADIGDEQSIEASLSTFSSHITKIKKIIDNATNKSLILLDELGSGTDPKEGSNLAIAIIDYFKNLGSSIIASTHYNELKNYAHNNPEIINASLEFNLETLKPTYRLIIGISGKSYALEISKRLGIKDEIIEHAKTLIDNNLNNNVDVDKIEAELTKILKEKDEIEAIKAETLKIKSDYEKQKIDLVKKKEKIINEAINNAKKIIDEAKGEANNLINEIKNMSENNFKEHELAKLKNKTNNLDINYEEEEIFEEELNVDDYVYIKPYDKTGRIIKIKKNKYFVQFGQFQMEFLKSDLTKTAAPVEKQIRQTRLSGVNPKAHASLSLDLRGKRYEEVNNLIDEFFDQAMLGNLKQLTIIHGFGTGAIRKAVWECLKTSPYVKSYRYGGEGEGLNGVTVVYLK